MLQYVIDKIISMKIPTPFNLQVLASPLDEPPDFILANLIRADEKGIMPCHRTTLKQIKAREIALYQMAFDEDWKDYKPMLNQKHKKWDVVFEKQKEERQLKIRNSAIQSIAPKGVKVANAVYESAKILLSEESSIYIRINNLR